MAMQSAASLCISAVTLGQPLSLVESEPVYLWLQILSVKNIIKM